MKVRRLHRWDVSPRAAARLQERLAARVRMGPALSHFDLVAGADVSFHRPTRTIYAGVVLFDVAAGQVIERAEAIRPESFPYVPGLLSFREVPALLDAFRKLRRRPDVVLADAQGRAHPRRFGLACHLGICLDLPTVGCAKSRLIGRSRTPGLSRRCRVQLKDDHETIGMVVRTRSGVKPVWVSIGHLIDLPSAVRLVLGTTRGYRLPEPARLAHLYVNRLRRRRC